VTSSAFERRCWRGGRYAYDTPDIMGCRSGLNPLSPLFADSLSFSLLQERVDSIPIASLHPPQTQTASFKRPYQNCPGRYHPALGTVLAQAIGVHVGRF